MSPDQYDLDLYVQREQFFGEFWEWFSSSSPEYRLRSLVGPPGIGKSWFMWHIHNELKSNPKNYLPIWLDLRRRDVYPDSSPLKKFLDVAGGGNGRDRWLRQIIDQINQTCHLQIIFNPSISFHAMFSHIVERLCQHCGTVRPILLVDGYDEVASEADRHELQELVFATFWGHGCTRILIARRDVQEFPHHILSWNEEPITLYGFNETQRKTQIDEWHDKYPTKPEIYDNISPYLTHTPYINRLLIDLAVKKHPAPLEPSDLENCIDTVAKRAGLNEPSTEFLKQLAKDLPQTWTALILLQEFTIRIDDDKLKPLFKTGLIHQVTDTARYRVEVGLYSLLCSLLPKYRGGDAK